MLEELTDYIAAMPEALRMGLPLLFLVFAIVAETALPLFQHEGRLRHIGQNLTLLAGIAIINLVIGFLVYGFLGYSDDMSFGLFSLVEVPFILQFVICLLVLDFVAQYLAHAMLHRYRSLWKLHIVHHSDRTVDASTGARLHPLDYGFREVLAWTVVLLLGVPLGIYILYRTLTAFFTFFTHANLRMPEQLDRLVCTVFVTPNMHKVHHHFERPWTNCNYGNLFSWWDRLCGTFAYVETDKLQYGLDVLDDRDDTTALQLFTLPFDNTVRTDY